MSGDVKFSQKTVGTWPLLGIGEYLELLKATQPILVRGEVSSIHPLRLPWAIVEISRKVICSTGGF